MTPPPHASCRPLGLDDALAAAQLHEVAAREPWSLQSWEALLSDPLSFGQGFFTEGGIQGLVLARAVGGECEILMVLVAPTWRRRGLAASLMKATLEAAARRGVSDVCLEVADDNRAALALYDRLDFLQIGCRTGYYAAENGRTDALVLRRDLSDLQPATTRLPEALTQPDD